MQEVFGNDKLGRSATTLYQSSLQQSTYDNYGSNFRRFFKYCEVLYIEPLSATPVDIARYLAWLGERGTIIVYSL